MFLPTGTAGPSLLPTVGLGVGGSVRKRKGLGWADAPPPTPPPSVMLLSSATEMQVSRPSLCADPDPSRLACFDAKAPSIFLSTSPSQLAVVAQYDSNWQSEHAGISPDASLL